MGSNVATKFSAGELRSETGGGMAYVALGSQTGGAVNVAEAMSNLLLQRILGTGSNVKYGVGSGSLSQAVASAGGNAAASGICQMYSDAGLVGALIVSALRSASVTEQQVAGAKNQLLADVYTLLENPLDLVENMGVQALVSGDVMPVEKYPEIIKGISTADVQAAAKKLAGSKLALGAVGNLSSVPYLDSL